MQIFSSHVFDQYFICTLNMLSEPLRLFKNVLINKILSIFQVKHVKFVSRLILMLNIFVNIL